MEDKVKVVIDTCIFVSAFKSRQATSKPIKVINYWLKGDKFFVIMTPQLLDEIIRTFNKCGIDDKATKFLVNSLQRRAVFYSGTFEVNILDDIDPDDNIIFAAALESGADYIVSLDKKHILPLKKYGLIGKVTQIVDDEIFLNFFTE
ncbi:MAG: hypothetical protein N5P05_001616 [Chroococcopsis gigantea SAG 12.99]|jgi:putative PIN family toxin of toxin-antitoxin system|nr:hypothetical protein [Chroococcopsis gigantea SAG 12.99]